jgi:hypothetical protein
VVIAILARPDGGLGDHVVVLAHLRRDALVADIASTCGEVGGQLSCVQRARSKVGVAARA